jgi:P pilus assembly chaperone PapD
MLSARAIVRLTALSSLFAIAPQPAHAQTIRPVVSEYQLQARGRLEVVNDSDRPLNVVIEPHGFSVSDSGEMQEQPFPAGVHLELSATSLRLPPRQSRFVFYEARAERGPAWFVLYANFTGFPAHEFSGLNVQLELPHIVYLLPKEAWKRTDLHVTSVDVHADTGVVALVIENDGPSFGRVSSLQIEGPRRKFTVPGFALFPGRQRRVEIPWDGSEPPASVDVKTKEFSFTERVPPPAP